MQYSTLIQIKTNNTSDTAVYTEPAAEQSTWGSQVLVRGGGAKFKIKHKSRCLQKSKLVDWGAQARRFGVARPPAPPGAGPESTPSRWATKLKI